MVERISKWLNLKHPTQDFWEPSKKKLYGDSSLLKKLMEYDKDNIAESVVAKVQPFMDNPSFDPEAVKKSSLAAAGICKWVRAMIIYERVAKLVGPKREQLAVAQATLKEAVDNLETKQKELADLLAALKQLEDDLAASKQKQEDLGNQVIDCQVKLERANKLIGGVGGEKGRWKVSSARLGESFTNLTGDILISSAQIVYLGVFTAGLRREEITSWIEALNEAGIPCTQEFALPDIIGEPVKVRQWVIDKLPNDGLSIDNAIMMTNSSRWPLMIDPQLQANKWIRTMRKDNLKVLRLTQGDYARHLETAIQFGVPVMIENIGETLDPMLQPLLERAIFKAGSLSMIRLGDNTIEYSNDFRLFLTTKLPNPHYAPEVCVTVIVLNFVTTFEGLSDALLAILVAKESPDIERKRQELVVDSANSKAQLQEIEDKILYLLSASTGNILDDEELIQTLANSKVTSQRIEERVVVQERTAKEIAEVREFNSPVAQRSAALFFTVSDLAGVESNYQYSLEWFVSIFLDSIDAAPKARGEARLKNLNESFMKKLYVNICRSLFEKDKMLFSFTMAIKMLEFDEELNKRELNLLMQGGGGGGELRKPKPEGCDWLTDPSWSKVLELDRLGEIEYEKTQNIVIGARIYAGWDIKKLKMYY
jgi:dynein heavy chain, axonemal